jgi:sugar (pentulose or hexulose) kinase
MAILGIDLGTSSVKSIVLAIGGSVTVELREMERNKKQVVY